MLCCSVRIGKRRKSKSMYTEEKIKKIRKEEERMREKGGTTEKRKERGSNEL
jgi:hypothetical protein